MRLKCDVQELKSRQEPSTASLQCIDNAQQQSQNQPASSRYRTPLGSPVRQHAAVSREWLWRDLPIKRIPSALAAIPDTKRGRENLHSRRSHQEVPAMLRCPLLSADTSASATDGTWWIPDVQTTARVVWKTPCTPRKRPSTPRTASRPSEPSSPRTTG